MWFVVALIVGAGIAALAFWLRGADMKVSWYEWLIGIVGLLLMFFAIQNFFGSGAEGETEAANMFLLAVGLPALVLILLSAGLAWRRRSAS